MLLLLPLLLLLLLLITSVRPLLPTWYTPIDNLLVFSLQWRWRTNIISAEGTRQGDPLAMRLYARSLQPLLTRLRVSSAAKQYWFADDATGSGSLQDVRKWWDEISESGPALDYFPNAQKFWLIIKPEREQSSPYHSLKLAMQPSLSLCGTVGHISLEHYQILQKY